MIFESPLACVRLCVQTAGYDGPLEVTNDR
jgi:hypothetical protein